MGCQIKRMTKSQKAVAIAKDVISRIKLKKLKVNQKGYFNPLNLFSLDQGIPLQSQVEFLESKCEVCALGGMLLSYTRLFNNVESVPDIWQYNFDFITNKLCGIFPIKTLVIIEGVFENSLVNSEECFSPSNARQIEERVIRYRGKILSRYKFTKYNKKEIQKVILLAICRNIVRNKGKFILPK